MGNDPKEHSFQKEYQEFMGVADKEPPPSLSEQILSAIHAKLHPPLSIVLAKVAGLYAIGGALVLLICPQFGLTLAAETGLMRWFGLLGAYPCMALCGALFLGTGTLASSLLLSPEELRVLKPNRIPYFVGFALMALTLFWILGAEIALGLGIAWFAGSVISETLAFELGWRMRVSPQFRKN